MTYFIPSLKDILKEKGELGDENLDFKNTSINFEEPEFEYKESIIRKILLKLVNGFVSFTIILLLWYGIAQWVIHTRNVPFPTPKQTFSRLFALLKGENLYGETIYDHVTASLIRWGIGFALAALFGILLGIALGSSKILYDTTMPTVYVIQLIPGLAWIPIALLIFGLGNTSTIFMIFATAFAPIVINTCGGIRSVPPVYVRAAKMMGAGKITVFFRVMLPASALSVVNGLRIGLANGWRVLIAAEMIVGVGQGLGFSIIQSRWSLDFESAFVCIVIICIIGLLIEKLLFEIIENKVVERIGLTEGK